ncbi:MAG: FAD-dependent oxidoreductase [Alphaproteobacteria bacterium]|nr:FAD-dependent oxidoreductase [Alphaproteobacteria bacterium]
MVTEGVESADVIVVGGGIAGLAAALSAREGGASVILVERAPEAERGGNTRYTEAFLRMKSVAEVADDFEARFAANAGGHLDPGLTRHCADPYADWPGIVRALGFADPEVVAAFAAAAGPTLQWLGGHGISFDLASTPFLTLSAPRMAPVGGGLAMVEALYPRLAAAGVQVHYQTTMQDLVQDEAGRVVGIRAVASGHRALVLGGRSVVLACGGFQGNPEMLARYLGPRALLLRPVARGGYYNKGEGIAAALRLGAAPAGDFGSYHAEPVDPRSGIAEPAVFAFPYGILVNRAGRRFCDEAPGRVDATYEAITRMIWAQPGGIGYMIFDAGIEDVPRWRVAVRSDQPPIQAASLGALAAALELPAETLASTVAAYNAACRPGTFTPLAPDGLATVGLDPPKSNFARPLDSPPFRALPIISANVFTFGGLKVTPRAEVLNSDGDAIPGLYAAGEVVGLYYGTYTGSTSVLKGAVFGRIAGAEGARRARGNRP